MKAKLLLPISLLCFSAVAFAQKQGADFQIHTPVNIPPVFAKADTIGLPNFDPGCTPVVGLLTQAGAQVSGTNSFGDKEKAQLIRIPGGGSVVSAVVAFGKKWQGPAAGTTNYTVKLYAATASGPGTFLGLSQPVNFSNIDTTGAFTNFNFAAPVQIITDSFYVSVEVSPITPNNDSVAVTMVFNNPDPTVACGLNTAYERQSDNSWHLMNGQTSAEWGVDVMFVALPVMTNTTVGMEEPSALSNHQLFPNPSNGIINLSYSLNQQADVNISIVDLSGKTVQQIMLPAQYSGAYNQVLDVSSYAAGIYTYRIQTNGVTTAGKFVVH